MKKQSWDITDPVTGDKYTLKKGMRVVVVRESNKGLNGHENPDNPSNLKIGFIDEFEFMAKNKANSITKDWIGLNRCSCCICPSLVRPYNPPTP